MEKIKDKKIAIMGFGKEGLSAANFLGFDNRVSIVDDKRQEEIDKSFFGKLKVAAGFYFGCKYPQDSFDLVIRSPGVRMDHPLITKLITKGATLTSSTKIFFDSCPCEIIGVTGTKGKGTTSTLIYEILRTQFQDVFLCGNIGTPVLDILPKLKKTSVAVLELSSFQLMDLKKSPHVSVVLMITSEHLDWHKDTSEYRSAKENIVRHQKESDWAVINQDFEISKSFAQKTKAKVYFVSTEKETNGVYVRGDEIISNISRQESIISAKEILLPGRHNLQNVVAASSVAKIKGIKNKNIAKVLKIFKGLPHRLQLVGVIKGIQFYNDSFSTTPETTIAAIESFANPKILILGGSSKNSDFTTLSQKIVSDRTIKALILIGVEGPRIKRSIDKAGGFKGTIIKEAKKMQEIVQASLQLNQSGDVVLLSPACASFDMFKNYQDRGEQFIKEILKIKKQQL